jgi:hypothetical protein
MQVIKKLVVFILLFSLFTCTEEEPISFDNSIGSFVQFRLQVKNNNNLIEAPIVDNATTSVSSYSKDNFKELKIPVTFTTESLDAEVSVNFTTEISNLQGVEITPKNTLTFASEKRVDTIYIKFKQRWNTSLNPEIKLALVSSSNSEVNLGIPNNINPNNELTIGFKKLDFSYQFATPNRKEIIGNLNEQVTIDVLFPNGYVQTEIENEDLLIEEFSNFDYTLDREPLTNSTKISYTLTLSKAINTPILAFETRFKMTLLNDYTLIASDSFLVRKPVVIDRDNAVNTASKFYNLSNPYNRTFGENWLFDSGDNRCEWKSFFAFTYPVIVDSNHPNAILFDDLGTTNTTDDVYHHAFRIGFNSPNARVTTNSFNLKRWFTNEATNYSNSPGFNIPEALAFFPENGSSTQGGIVRVIEQDLVISGKNGNTYIIHISGQGTYQKINNDLFEISLALQAENNLLFGGIIRSKYLLYNNSNYPNPTDINENCIQEIML